MPVRKDDQRLFFSKSMKRVPYTDNELASITKYFKNIKDSVTPSLKECRKFLASFPIS